MTTLIQPPIQDAYDKTDKPQTAQYDFMGDPVNSPRHYKANGMEAIDAIRGSMTLIEYKGYLKGNAMKYLWRYDNKGNPKQDLRKAKWYLEKLIEVF